MSSSLVRRVERELKEAGDPKRAAGSKRYLKSDLTFYGANLAATRATARSIVKKEALEHGELEELVLGLWSAPVFERRMVAVILLELHAAMLGPDDLSTIERLIRESKTWALVDGLAVNVVGEIALHHRTKRNLDAWARDEDFWIRRSSLLAEMKGLKQGADFKPFAARADSMLGEKEFFIRKAIGWVLREMSKKRPDEVYEWIAPRTHRASGVTMRETVKYLDPAQADLLMRAYKERRPVPLGANLRGR